MDLDVARCAERAIVVLSEKLGHRYFQQVCFECNGREWTKQPGSPAIPCTMCRGQGRVWPEGLPGNTCALSDYDIIQRLPGCGVEFPCRQPEIPYPCTYPSKTAKEFVDYLLHEYAPEDDRDARYRPEQPHLSRSGRSELVALSRRPQGLPRQLQNRVRSTPSGRAHQRERSQPDEATASWLVHLRRGPGS